MNHRLYAPSWALRSLLSPQPHTSKNTRTYKHYSSTGASEALPPPISSSLPLSVSSNSVWLLQSDLTSSKPQPHALLSEGSLHISLSLTHGLLFSKYSFFLPDLLDFIQVRLFTVPSSTVVWKWAIQMLIQLQWPLCISSVPKPDIWIDNLPTRALMRYFFFFWQKRSFNLTQSGKLFKGTPVAAALANPGWSYVWTLLGQYFSCAVIIHSHHMFLIVIPNGCVPWVVVSYPLCQTKRDKHWVGSAPHKWLLWLLFWAKTSELKIGAYSCIRVCLWSNAIFRQCSSLIFHYVKQISL